MALKKDISLGDLVNTGTLIIALMAGLSKFDEVKATANNAEKGVQEIKENQKQLWQSQKELSVGQSELSQRVAVLSQTVEDQNSRDVTPTGKRSVN